MQRQLTSLIEQDQQREIDYRLSSALSYEDYPVIIANNPDLLSPMAYLCCFSKSLPHDENGSVDKTQFKILLDAIFRNKNRFKDLKLGGQMKLVAPSCIFSYESFGAPKSSYEIADVPAISSAEAIGEMIELYWMSVLRDVPFSQWNSSPLVKRAVDDMNRLSNFLGPKINGKVTPSTLFRGGSEGDLIGSYTSQFLLLPFKQGIAEFDQKYKFAYPGINYMTDKDEVIRILNGIVLPDTTILPVIPRARLISTLRDGGSYVHFDEPVQAFENAIRILMGLKVPTNPGNPYINPSLGLRNEAAFVDYAIVDIFDMVHRVSRIIALACWFQKWSLLRLRPEEFSLLLQRKESGDPEVESIKIHPDWDNSDIKSYIQKIQDNVLLSGACTTGSPCHPSYPSGHAAFSGAAATVVKAFFNNDTTFRGIDGNTYTLHHELDKLASNIGSFRNVDGIHYRSDMEQGIILGEQVAIRFLQEEVKRYPGAKYIITKRNGDVVTISA